MIRVLTQAFSSIGEYTGGGGGGGGCPGGEGCYFSQGKVQVVGAQVLPHAVSFSSVYRIIDGCMLLVRRDKQNGD